MLKNKNCTSTKTDLDIVFKLFSVAIEVCGKYHIWQNIWEGKLTWFVNNIHCVRKHFCRFAQNYLFWCSNYKAGKFSAVKHLRLMKKPQKFSHQTFHHIWYKLRMVEWTKYETFCVLCLWHEGVNWYFKQCRQFVVVLYMHITV